MTKKSYSIFDVVKDTINGTVEKTEANVSSKRIEICNICPDYKSSLRTCMKCGCYIPQKVKYKEASCPLGKW